MVYCERLMFPCGNCFASFHFSNKTKKRIRTSSKSLQSINGPSNITLNFLCSSGRRTSLTPRGFAPDSLVSETRDEPNEFDLGRQGRLKLVVFPFRVLSTALLVFSLKILIATGCLRFPSFVFLAK